ncbi:MAG: molybdopterin-dependent oxidoreductase [Acidobacteriota bacterium]
MRLFHTDREDRRPASPGERLPPGQSLTTTWPVLTYGAVPRVDRSTWQLHVSGAVHREATWSWDQFLALPRVCVRGDIHCVTRWSRLDNLWEGVAARTVLARVRPSPRARFALIHCEGGYSTSLELSDLGHASVLFAWKHDGTDLAPEHGGPCRLLVPERYFWKSAKWVRRVELLEEDRPGLWERSGAHPRGNPWAEERDGWGRK